MGVIIERDNSFLNFTKVIATSPRLPFTGIDNQFWQPELGQCDNSWRVDDLKGVRPILTEHTERTETSQLAHGGHDYPTFANKHRKYTEISYLIERIFLRGNFGYLIAIH